MYNLEVWKKQKKELKLTFEELSEKSGISISTLKNIFNGYTPDPRMETVKAIETALDLIHTDTYTTLLEEELIEVFRDFGNQYGTDGKSFFPHAAILYSNLTIF